MGTVRAVILLSTGLAIGATGTYVAGTATAQAAIAQPRYEAAEFTASTTQRNQIGTWLTNHVKPRLEAPFSTQTIDWCKVGARLQVTYTLDANTDGTSTCNARVRAGMHLPGDWVAGSAE